MPAVGGVSSASDGSGALAKSAGVGFTSLPPVKEFLREKIVLSEASFAARVTRAGHQRYMFVLEDALSGKIGGRGAPPLSPTASNATFKPGMPCFDVTAALGASTRC